MSNHQFISYSSVDAKDFAMQPYEALKAVLPSIPVWRDKHDLKPGKEWTSRLMRRFALVTV